MTDVDLLTLHRLLVEALADDSVGRSPRTQRSTIGVDLVRALDGIESVLEARGIEVPG